MDKNIREMLNYSGGGILSKEIVRGGSLDVTLFCMAGGTEISEHTSTKEGFVYVIEGKGTFMLNVKKIHMAPGTFIHMGRNAVHSLKAEENTSFMLALFR